LVIECSFGMFRISHRLPTGGKLRQGAHFCGTSTTVEK
jgi:hypothetical protein